MIEDIGIAGDKAFKALAQAGAFAGYVGQKIGGGHDLGDAGTDGTGQRIAAIGRTVGCLRPYPEAASSVASTAPSGKPPPDALGDHHDVRFDPGPFMGE